MKSPIFVLPASLLKSASTQCCTSDVGLTAFCLGVSSPLFLPDLFPLWLLACVMLVALFLTIFFRPLSILLCFSIGLSWASVQFDLHRGQLFPAEFERVDVELTGTVVDLPNQSKGDWRFRLQIDQIQNAKLKRTLGKYIQLSCYRCPFEISPGQQWTFTVRLKRPHSYASYGAFDYEKYLFRHRLIARGYVRTKDSYELQGQKGFLVNRWRNTIRKTLRSMGDGVGIHMIAALAIGDKSGFTQDQKRVFQETGVSHLMAISGLHIGLVFLGVSWLMKWLLWPAARLFDRLPRQHLALLPALASAIVYAALAGFAVSTQRALLMLFVFVACRLWVRDVSLFKVLLIAASLLLIYDPFSVLDIGFWLSCGAVLIIALISQYDKTLSLLRLQPRLWLGMVPMTTLFFGQVSLISPAVNLLMVPLFCSLLIPLTLFALLTMQCGLDCLGVFLINWLSWAFEYVYRVLEKLSSWPFARWYTTPFNVWQWGVVLLIVVLEVRRVRGRFVLWLILLSSVFINTSSGLKADELRVTLLDVGQGLAMVIRTQDSVTVYDTGPRYGSGFTAADAVLLPYLRTNGVQKIDTLIISHADNDHIGGFQSVSDSFDIGRVVTSRTDKIPTAQACQEGQAWQYDDTQFRILSPERDTPKGSNNHSCVVLIEHFGTKILLSGDIEKQVERFLVNRYRTSLAADVLLVPHQGSKTSSTDDFLSAVDPQLAMVAAGYRNHYGHPHPEVLDRYKQRGIKMLSTIDAGTIELLVDGQGWRTSRYRKAEKRFWHYQKVSNR